MYDKNYICMVNTSYFKNMNFKKKKKVLQMHFDYRVSCFLGQSTEG